MSRPTILLMGSMALTFCISQQAEAGFINGSFESPSLGGLPYAEFEAGSAFPGWKVEAGNVDIVGFGMPANPTGPQYLDLNGSGPGTVSQVMQADMGVTYELSFDYGGGIDFDLINGIYYGDSSGNSIIYQLFDGSSGATLFQGSVLIQTSNLLNWTTLSVQATATSSLLGVRFQSDGLGADGYYGPYIDSVSLVPVDVGTAPEPSSLCLAAIGGLFSLAYHLRRR